MMSRSPRCEDHIADAHPDLPRKPSRADLLAEIRANANDE